METPPSQAESQAALRRIATPLSLITRSGAKLREKKGSKEVRRAVEFFSPSSVSCMLEGGALDSNVPH